MKKLLFVPLALVAMAAGAATRLLQDQCGPFTDVPAGICPYVLEMYYLGITAGTSATTFSPNNPVTRGQAAVFVSKTFDQAVARSSRRAALGQWWTTTPQYANGLGVTNITGLTQGVASDGADLWVARPDEVVRVRASDGTILQTWTGATSAESVLVAMGRVFVTGHTDPGSLYMIDPTQPPGAVTTVASNLGSESLDLAFDGSRIWTSNNLGLTGSVSIVTPGTTLPWTVTTVTGFQGLFGMIFDGANIWVGEVHSGDLLKLDANGAILQRVHVGTMQFIGFDGTNIWVPNPTFVSVVSAASGQILATLTGNGLTDGNAAAFDGERVLITNYNTNTLSLWKAADLTPLGFFSTGATSLPNRVCSDGVNFWVTLQGTGQLARF
jgi:hypothetical protein